MYLWVRFLKKKKTPAVQAIIRGTRNSLENLPETERMKQ